MKTLFLILIIFTAFTSYSQISLKDLQLTDRDYKKLKFESRVEKTPQLLLKKDTTTDRSRFYLMAECVQYNGFSFRLNEPGYNECLEQDKNSKTVNMGLQWYNKK